MNDSKYQYIKKQLAKTNKKNDENYVVTRLWHLINNFDVKMVTQQYIWRNESYAKSKYALADIYFPQFKLIVEIDELHHENALNIKLDQTREKDIINATGFTIKRVKMKDGIDKLHEDIDAIVKEINLMISSLQEKFVPWDLEKEMNPNTYIKRGYIDADDETAFRRIVDCCNCFGSGYKGLQGSGAAHKFENDIDIKGLKFVPNIDWDNRLSEDESYFIERNKSNEENKSYQFKRLSKWNQEHALFAKATDNLGIILYRFKGRYRVNKEKSIKNNCVYWERISKVMATYYPESDEGKQEAILYLYNKEGILLAKFYETEEFNLFLNKKGIKMADLNILNEVKGRKDYILNETL
ncbi:AbaSI family restriction endonuclease [Gottfriedia acidiceleris]|uniref:AbaSI family restriction endonuclease n=1 Tax=Gottfriedia acidiceleris TaxID=371036 RepID=UPI00111C5A64|nr:DUF559 domain-containing protein [Gottfriedia acidiceleris]